MNLQIPPALKNRKFALYWLGIGLSIAGSMMAFSALLWHLRLLSDQPIVVSGIGLANFIPIPLLAPFGGVIADRYNRRKILFITQSLMVFTSLGLGFLTTFGIIKVWHIYLLSIIQAAAFAFDLPARQAMLPNIVSRDLLPNAFSLQSIAFSLGSVLGPAIGGMIIGYIGLHVVYFVDAVSYGAFITALVLIGNIRQGFAESEGAGRTTLQSIKDGIQFIKGQPIILASMLLDFNATFFSSANTLLPFIARDVLHVGEVAYGWLASGQAIGAALIGILISQVRELKNQGVLLIGSVLVFGAATALLGAIKSMIFAMFALIIIGASDGISSIIRNTLRQLLTPDNMRGRMTSLNQIFFMGGPQLGEIEAGLVAQGYGTPIAVFSGGIACIFATLLIAVKFPQLKKYRGDEAVPVPAGN